VALTLDSHAIAWLLRPPAESLGRAPMAEIRPAFAALNIASSAFSMALAETRLLDASLGRLAYNTFSLLLGLFLVVGLFFELSRAAGREQADWREWIVAGAFTMAPLHLTLPIALLAKGFGDSGLILYELGKLFVFVTVAKRWLITIRRLNAWPGWAASLLLFAPAAMGLIGMGFLMITLFGAFLLLLAGAAG
jgi:hypothetical protein